ncbi:hypothetical protein BDF20DRAFT_311967 [Mycotypha africana]|uniref:uncharacterized protein n=1 Tax=Mycotypha africana TaxID=64632 RepID=UPI002300FA8E|nr:uncharacterized protein BDF20DRAFT_311967 [Mycotypha africana]KAI8988214.1 hypothetical protein BDF20DRAFT_311967 [Mycotypha africana]
MTIPATVVYAIHNFEAENEDEINFLVGEPITVLEKDEKYMDGWWQGRNVHGETGLFPMNYTSPEKPRIRPTQLQQQQQQYMPSPLLSSRSSGSTVEEEIEHTISQLEISSNNTSSSSVEVWDVNQVASWLRMVGFESVASNFIDQEITGDILLDLNIDTLKELGVSTFGKRYKIMQAINTLKDGSCQMESTKPTPNSSVSTSAISSSRRSNTGHYLHQNKKSNSIRRSSSQTERMSTAGESFISTDNSSMIFQFPRKAPLPPSIQHQLNNNNENSDQGVFPQHSLSNSLLRPLSPQSLSAASSSTISRSNTYNTMSSSGSGSLRSQDTKPANSVSTPTGFRSPRRMLSQKSQQNVESNDFNLNLMTNQSQLSSTVSPSVTPSSTTANHHQQHHQPLANRNDWSTNDISNYSPANHSMGIHPLNAPTTSLSTPRQPTQIANTHKLSVSSFDEHTSRTSTSSEAFQAPEHEGWLHKQSDKYKTWNKRWFVLKGTNLFYFKSPKDVRMKGIINLRGYKIIVDETIHAGKYCFKAQHERERTFLFYTDTEKSMRVWLKMLMKTTIARDFRAPVMSSNHIATVSLDVARRMRPRPPSVIMYKNQKQLKMSTNSSNDPSKMMAMLEEEELEFIPSPPIIEEQQKESVHKNRQTCESGITVPHPANNSVEEEYTLFSDNHNPYHSQHLHPYDVGIVDQNQAALNRQKNRHEEQRILLNDEEEDLIDPQHRSLPSSQSYASSSSSSHSLIVDSSEIQQEGEDEKDNWSPQQYLNWVNAYLPPGKKVFDLSNGFRNGEVLIQLLEAISQKEVRRSRTPKGGSMSVIMLDNIVAAFKFMGREGVEVDGRYTIKDVFGGNEPKIITMLEAIKSWADERYPVKTSISQSSPSMKKSETSVLIDKKSGWRGSAMMDNRISLSDDDMR